YTTPGLCSVSRVVEFIRSIWNLYLANRATVCTGYTPLLEHFTVIGLSHNFTVNCETFFNFSHSCKPLQAAISFQQALDSIVVSEGLLNFVYVFAFHDIMNQNSIDTAEGNPVDEEVVIYFDEN
ncbi:hypothetical protein DAPPUDRAFT_336890, partial [Daphnia pulex]